MNKVSLLGRLTKDPELSYTPTNNTALCKFSLAVNKKAKEGADFFNIVAWGKTAEFCSKYFQKGKQIVLVGRLETRFWENAEGKKQYATDIVAEEVFFADSKPSDASEPTAKQTKQAPSYQPTFDDDELPF